MNYHRCYGSFTDSFNMPRKRKINPRDEAAEEEVLALAASYYNTNFNINPRHSISYVQVARLFGVNKDTLRLPAVIDRQKDRQKDSSFYTYFSMSELTFFIYT